MRYAVQVGFLFPFGFLAGGVGDDRAFGVVPAKFFNDPNTLHADQLEIEDAGAGQAMHQQRLGFLDVGAMDDAILLRVQTRANRFGEIRMSGQNQKGFHRAAVPNGPNLFSVGVTSAGFCPVSGFKSIHYWPEAYDKIGWKRAGSEKACSIYSDEISFSHNSSLSRTFWRNSCSLGCAACSGLSGREIENVVPWPGWLLASILPP